MGIGWGSMILFYRGPEGILQGFRVLGLRFRVQGFRI